jgi:chemotaxis protein methyltransferase CheR
MSAALDRLAELVHLRTGIRIQPAHRASLEAALARTAPAVEPSAFLALADDPTTGPEAFAGLVDEVTIKETSFLRDAGQLGRIDWHLLLASARSAGSSTIRVWGAACATGEEAYSLAMLACEAFGTPTPPVRILATDISRTAVAQARMGRYGQRSLRDVDGQLRERYLEAHDGAGSLVVGDSLRRLVTFERHNLVDDTAPPSGDHAFDLVVCRNVLIYFDADTVGRVVERLEAALAPGGTLLLGAADVLCVTTRRLAALDYGPRTTSAKPAPAQAARRPRPEGAPPRPAASQRAPTADQASPGLELALRAADQGRPEDAMSQVAHILSVDPLNVGAHFVRGVVELASGDAAAAVGSLRRALYADPSHALAAFKLGRAYDMLGDRHAAVRSYEQAVRLLDGETRPDAVRGDVDLADVAAASRIRIDALRSSLPSPRKEPT